MLEGKEVQGVRERESEEEEEGGVERKRNPVLIWASKKGCEEY